MLVLNFSVIYLFGPLFTILKVRIAILKECMYQNCQNIESAIIQTSYSSCLEGTWASQKTAVLVVNGFNLCKSSNT